MSDTEQNNLLNSGPSGNGQRPLILVVDDLPENLATLSAMVREDGADVRVANAGPVALRYARLAPQPDLILLDIMMPGMDGRAVLAELQKDELTRNIPVIFVTALGAAEDEERGLEEGAVDYITKPIKPAVLRARVRAQLELKRSRDLQANQQRWLEAEVQRRLSENAQLEAKLQLTLASTGFGIWEIDHTTGQCDWSQTLCQIFGREGGPETVSNFLTLVHPEDRRRVENFVSSLQGDAGVVHAEYRIQAPDGQWLWVEGRGKVIRTDPAGQPLLSVGTMNDITLRRTVEADRLLASAVFQGISDGICITDANGNILLINEAFSRVTGYSQDEVLGLKPGFLKSGVHGPAFYREMWEKIRIYGNWQ
ncbi:MAG TPA: response regulator, partial [Azonexus sp.]|nr:response regulator [Azonexus sp.]